MGNFERPLRSQSVSVFISSSWDSDDHIQWVRKLARRFEAEGFKVIIDDQVSCGNDISKFMENGILGSDLVLAICTNAYKSKFDSGRGGAGYEGKFIKKRIMSGGGSDTILPILRQRDIDSAVPGALSLNWAADFRENSEAQLQKLLTRIRGSGKPSERISACETAEAAIAEIPKSTPPDPEELIAKSRLVLMSQKRDASLCVWLKNNTLDPLNHCSLTLTNLQEYSDTHRKFRRNPLSALILIRPHTINSGGSSEEAAAIVRCGDVRRKVLIVSDGKIQVRASGTWLVELTLGANSQTRRETLFFIGHLARTRSLHPIPDFETGR